MLGYEAKDIETTFKEESNRRRSDIYEAYQSFVHKQLIFGKEKSQLPPEFTKARMAQQEREREANAAAVNANNGTSSDVHDVQSMPLSPGIGKGKDNLQVSSGHNLSNSKLSKVAGNSACATTNNNENIITDF